LFFKPLVPSSVPHFSLLFAAGLPGRIVDASVNGNALVSLTVCRTTVVRVEMTDGIAFNFSRSKNCEIFRISSANFQE